MRIILNKLPLFLSFFLGTIFTIAQVIPPPPENPESGDIGGPATPIDNNLLLLFLVGMSLVVIFIKKTKKISLQK